MEYRLLTSHDIPREVNADNDRDARDLAVDMMFSITRGVLAGRHRTSLGRLQDLAAYVILADDGRRVDSGLLAMAGGAITTMSDGISKDILRARNESPGNLLRYRTGEPGRYVAVGLNVSFEIEAADDRAVLAAVRDLTFGDVDGDDQPGEAEPFILYRRENGLMVAGLARVIIDVPTDEYDLDHARHYFVRPSDDLVDWLENVDRGMIPTMATPRRIPSVRITDAESLQAVPFSTLSRYVGALGWRNTGQSPLDDTLTIWRKGQQQVQIWPTDDRALHASRMGKAITTVADVEGVSELAVYWALLDMMSVPPGR